MNFVHGPTILSVAIGATLTSLDLWLFWRAQARSRPARHLRLIRGELRIRPIYCEKERSQSSVGVTGLKIWQQLVLLNQVAYRDVFNPDPPAAA